VAIDRLPSGSFGGRLTINGQRYTATLPTEADARVWEIQTRAAVAVCRRAGRVTFAAYAANWLAALLDDAPDRARFEAALEHRLLPIFGELSLLEVLDADRDELHRRLVDVGGDDDAARECLELVLEDAIHDWMPGDSMSVQGWAAAGPANRSRSGPPRCAPARRSAVRWRRRRGALQRRRRRP